MTTESRFDRVSNLTGIAQGKRGTDPEANTPHRDRPAGMAHLKLVSGNVTFNRVGRRRAPQHQFQVSIDKPPGSKKSEWPLHLAVERTPKLTCRGRCKSLLSRETVMRPRSGAAPGSAAAKTPGTLKHPKRSRPITTEGAQHGIIHGDHISKGTRTKLLRKVSCASPILIYRGASIGQSAGPSLRARTGDRLPRPRCWH